MKILSLRVVQGTYFLYLGRDYLHLIFIPFIQRDVRFTPILFLLTFYLGTDFCQIRPDQSYSLPLGRAIGV